MSPGETWSHDREATSRIYSRGVTTPLPEMWLQSRERMGNNNLNFDLIFQSPSGATYQLCPTVNQLWWEPWWGWCKDQRLIEMEEKEDISKERKVVEVVCWFWPVFDLRCIPCPTLPCSISKRITFPSFLCPLFSASVQPMRGVGIEGRC